MPMMKFSKLLDFTALAIRPGEPADDGQELQVGEGQRLYGLYVDGRQIFLSSDPVLGLAPELLLVLPNTEPVNIPLACIPSHAGADSVLTVGDGNAGGSARLMCPVCNSVVCCCSDHTNDEDDSDDDDADDAEERCHDCANVLGECVCERCVQCDHLLGDCTCERCDRCERLEVDCECARCNSCDNFSDECSCEAEADAQDRALHGVEGGVETLVGAPNVVDIPVGDVAELTDILFGRIHPNPNPCAEVSLPVEKPIPPNTVPPAGVTCHVCDRPVTECICT